MLCKSALTLSNGISVFTATNTEGRLESVATPHNNPQESLIFISSNVKTYMRISTGERMRAMQGRLM